MYSNPVAPSPVVALNRAVAVAMHQGAERGLALVDDLFAQNLLLDYHLAYAARADFCRRLGRVEEARAAYQRALDLAVQAPEGRFLQRRRRAHAYVRQISGSQLNSLLKVVERT